MNHSPIIKPSRDFIRPPEMKFTEAMQAIIDGKRVTKREWANDDIYGILKDGFLMLHKADDKFYQWIVSEGDLTGEDWKVLPDQESN